MKRLAYYWLCATLGVIWALLSLGTVQPSAEATEPTTAAAPKPDDAQADNTVARLAQLADASWSAAEYPQRVVPLLRKYCFDCHDQASAEGSLALDRYPDFASTLANRKSWDTVLQMVESGSMPPANQPRPSEAEREAFLNYLGEGFRRADAAAPADPGRVTIRRLNRTEYTNTIRDLVGIEFDTTKDFPRDDVGYGFDNIGDVLSLSPMLLDKYLLAAERIATQAIVSAGDARHVLRFAPTQMRRTNNQRAEPNLVSLYTNAEAYVQVKIPARAEYTIRVRAYAEQAGDELAKMTIRAAGQAVETFDVATTDKKPEVYETRVVLEPGNQRIGAAFINDYYKPEDPKDPDPENRDRNLFVMSIEVQSPAEVPLVELPEVHRRLLAYEPAAGENLDAAARQSDAARQILGRFARRAFRRPVSDEEVERLVKLAESIQADGGSFELGIQVAVQAVLVSPHFLYRVELDDRPAADGQSRHISPFAMASRLSYFLWSSMPDEELLALAEANRLAEPEVLAAQVERMLADPRSMALVENFGSQWLTTRSLDESAPNPQSFPEFNDALRSAMTREVELFLTDVMRHDRSLLELLDADYTYLNEPLAKLYGIEGITGREFRRVELPESMRAMRGGVLTMAAVLTVTSSPTRTNPVKRGKWILENVLGTPPPDPPPDVPDLVLDRRRGAATRTLRQQLERHRADPNCATCHARMDPLGFGLENYNAIGAWRDSERGGPIDASGEMPDGQSFNTPVELKAYLSSRPRDFARCLSEKMLTFALGRGLESYDRRVVSELVDTLEQHDYRFSALILGVVNSQPFQMCRGTALENAK